MPPQFRRYLPLLLIAFLALIVLPRLIHRHRSGLSNSEKAAQTTDAMNLIDAGEQRFKAAHGRFTGHLADLLRGENDLRQRRIAERPFGPVQLEPGRHHQARHRFSRRRQD